MLHCQFLRASLHIIDRFGIEFTSINHQLADCYFLLDTYPRLAFRQMVLSYMLCEVVAEAEEHNKQGSFNVVAD